MLVGNQQHQVAHVVAGIDTSIAAGDLETDSDDPARILGRPSTPLPDVARAAPRP